VGCSESIAIEKNGVPESTDCVASPVGLDSPHATGAAFSEKQISGETISKLKRRGKQAHNILTKNQKKHTQHFENEQKQLQRWR